MSVAIPQPPSPTRGGKMQPVLNWAIAIVVFAGLLYLTFRWFRVLIIRYRVTQWAVQIRIFGLPIFRIPYRNIRSFDVVRASNLWRGASILSFPLWLHTRLFVDGVVIRSKWRAYVLTPEHPEEFVESIRERIRVLREPQDR